VIFVVFAISFFGFFEIGLPSSIANKAHSKSGHGNIGGIFFMAGTLAIVSFSCTGPILGTLLVGVADQGAWPLTAGAAGFGIALGFPFALFAMFPNWLKSLPKSGGWMTNVKVVLGFHRTCISG
jgi:thiol:disulfide interchange protein DsbD